ncbi:MULTISPECIES: nucleoside deaminase [Persicobacter]|uniref:tRNA-specific adenosine deaminase n=1 Tax=Persicobacter diffluens TaxID=981 RepID=A0AAN4VUP9_9BACT|nr:nucleoside deaminase [Persicobacter sp. CCB-QB2]GJM59737.1 tRNA-specific adenosine deaminase [Persicobacter diffluens]
MSELINPFDDNYFMRQALQEAEVAFEEEEIPVGAVVVWKNRIIARAHNQTERLSDVTAHAEMLAITAAANAIGGKYLKDCTLYVTMEPCTMCAGAIFWAQVSKVVFGAADLKRGYERLDPPVLHGKTEIVRGIMQAECQAIVDEFFQKLRK